MTELKAFFKQPETYCENKKTNNTKGIVKAWEKGYEISGHKIAIIGIVDSRHIENVNYSQNKTVNNIREQLTNLIFPNNQTIVDLGDLLPGKTIRDSYFALCQVLDILYSKQIIPILIGCSDDYIYGIYLSVNNIKTSIKHLHIDYKYDNHPDNPITIDTNNYFHHTAKLDKTVCELVLLGIQTYYSNTDNDSDRYNNLLSVHRLGWLNKNLFNTEPLLRNADIVTCDMNSVKISDNPANALGLPNGLYAEEICQIAWYAGYSGNTKIFGIFNYFSNFDHRNTSATLISQIIWHFIDGYNQSHVENPEKELKHFIQLHVHCKTISTNLLFLKSKKTGRYWLRLGDENEGSTNKYYPVSKRDYLEAVNNNVPDSIIKHMSNYYQK